VTTVVWRGLDEPRMELARVRREGTALRATGTQIGVAYELRYELAPDALRLEIVGGRTAEVELDGADFFDLGNSPLFNSLPVLRDGLLEGGERRDYAMRWVSVPALEVSEQRQRYVPLPDRVVRFEADDFVAEIRFGEDGLVEHYPGLAERVS
jgi:uncharacterized protein